MSHIARGFGGHFVSNPLYEHFNRVITVHPVGGCPMDTSLREGVVDTYGRMRGVPGLRVCDGSVFPGPIGPNPSLTIAAFARRSALNLLDEVDFAADPTGASEWDPTA
jgi:cholesterol oxidase